MAMKLNIDCPHCEARAGQICKDNCEANGDKIKELKIILRGVGLAMLLDSRIIEMIMKNEN